MNEQLAHSEERSRWFWPALAVGWALMVVGIVGMFSQRDRTKPYYSLNTVSEALPALGIVAAVLGIVKALGAIDQSPAILGGLIASALVGTFGGIFISYAFLSPLANKVKATREKQTRVYVIVKQALIAYMNGALPQIAVEHGRKGISVEYRPTIDEVEAATTTGGRSEELKEAA